MKKIIITLCAIFIAVTSFAQKSDTLKVDISKYNFIKIGDKVYKIVHSLEEVEPDSIINLKNIGNPYGIFRDPNIQLVPYDTGPALLNYYTPNDKYLYNNTTN